MRKLILGGITFTDYQMLPSFSYAENSIKRTFPRRSIGGVLRTQTTYTKAAINITGLAAGDFPDLNLEYERDTFLSLSSIKKRKEVFDGDGAATTFTLSRETRLDAGYEAVVEYPPGNTLVSGVDYTLSNVALKGELVFTLAPAAGTENAILSYFPILSVYCLSCRMVRNEWRSEESWTLSLEEA